MTTFGVGCVLVAARAVRELVSCGRNTNTIHTRFRSCLPNTIIKGRVTRHTSPDHPSGGPLDCWRCGDPLPPRLPSILLKPDPPLCLQPPWCPWSLWVSDACPGRGSSDNLVSRDVSVLLAIPPCLAPKHLFRSGGRESRPCVNDGSQLPP